MTDKKTMDNRIVFFENSNDSILDYITVDKESDSCPICHKNIKPCGVLYYEYGDSVNNSTEIIEVVYICPNIQCRELFIAYYERYKLLYNSGIYKLKTQAPIRLFKEEFDKNIKGISPQFVEIYNQSKAAEDINLNLICGMGYRKSLEFLIKDYLIKTVPEDMTEDVKTMPISLCIDKFIDNVKVKEMAKRAVWLGNDETHYTRLFEDKDINDLKNLIKLTLYHLQSEILTGEYEDKMKSKKCK